MTTNDNLPIAVEIADLAAEAAETSTPLDVDAEAQRLVDEHPEADADTETVKAALEEEERAANEAEETKGDGEKGIA